MIIVVEFEVNLEMERRENMRKNIIYIYIYIFLNIKYIIIKLVFRNILLYYIKYNIF